MKLFLLLSALFVSGCATNDWHWAKSGSTYSEFNMDMGQCKAQGISGTGGGVNIGTFMIINSCMQGKGWEQVGDK